MHPDLKIVFSIYVKNSTGILIGITLNPKMALGSMGSVDIFNSTDIFTVLTSDLCVKMFYCFSCLGGVLSKLKCLS